ncbi:hypothetical protein LTR22_026549 [Elasticomyces elasticus]|nr:hypothetical protein LTR22_026549 [Elasticomyces elasticus]
MSSSIVRTMSWFLSWVPRSSAVVNSLLLAASFSTASMLGYDASMMNALNILPSYTDYFHLTPATLGLNSGIVWIDAVVGCLVLAKVPDHIGRKPSLFYAAIVAVIGGALQAAAQNIAMFLVARFILGIGIGGVTYGTAKMDSTWAWRIPSLLQIILTLISIIALPWVPESPRYLVREGRQEEALMSRLELEKHLEDPSLKQIALDPGLRKRVLIVFTVAAFSMLTGSNLFSYYFGTALTNAGVTDSTTQLEINIILNSFCLVVSIAGTLLADRLGRKLLALLSTAGCMVFLFIIGALTKYYGESTNTTAIYANVAMMFLAQGSYNFGWTPLAVMYPPEVLNYSIRSIGMSWFISWQNLVLLVPIFTFPVTMTRIGWITYMLNGGFNVVVMVVVAWYWVETKNLSLEEVSGLFEPHTAAALVSIDATIQQADAEGIKVMHVREKRSEAIISA